MQICSNLNFDLLAVNTLKVVQDGNNLPVLTFHHPKAVQFELQLDNSVKLPLTETNYIDTGYNSQQTRQYSIIAIDNNQAKSLERTVILPVLNIQLQNTAPLQKTQFNTLIYKVSNYSRDNITDLKIQAQLGS